MYNKIDHDRTRRVRSETWLYQKVWLLNGYARGSLYMLYLLTLWKYGCWWFFTFIFIFFLLKRSLFSLFVRYQHFQYLQGNEYVLRGILFETLTGCMSFQGTNMKVFRYFFLPRNFHTWPISKEYIYTPNISVVHLTVRILSKSVNWLKSI